MKNFLKPKKNKILLTLAIFIATFIFVGFYGKKLNTAQHYERPPLIEIICYDRFCGADCPPICYQKINFYYFLLLIPYYLISCLIFKHKKTQ